MMLNKSVLFEDIIYDKTYLFKYRKTINDFLILNLKLCLSRSQK